MSWPFRKVDPHQNEKRRLDGIAQAHFTAQKAFDNALRNPFNPLEYFLTKLGRITRENTRGVFGALAGASFAFLGQGFGAMRPRFNRFGSVVPTRSLLRRVILGSALASAGGAVAVAAVVGAYWPLVDGDIAAVEHNLACADAHVLIDAAGYAGALPVHDCPQALVDSAPFDDAMALELLTAFSAIEGGVTRSETLLGQDLGGYVRYAASMVPFAQQAATALGMPFTRGGSSGFQTAVEFFNGTPHKLSLLEKPRMLVMGMKAAATVFRTDEERARLVGALPGIIGHGGRPFGGRHLAQVLFGHDPEETWEQCLFAAVIGKPLLLSDDSMLAGHRQASIKRAHGRAQSCIRKLVSGATAQATEMAALAAWKTPVVSAPASLDPAIRREVRAELRLALADDRAQFVSLTASRASQSRLIKAGDIAAGSGALKPIAGALQEGACLIGSGKECELPVGMLFASAEVVDDELVLRAVRSNVNGALFGALVRDGDGFTRTAPALGQGSISKLVHVLVAADRGVTTLCSKARGNLKDFDGFTGVQDCATARTSPARRSVAEAIAHSANLGFAHLVERFPEDFERMQEELGWLGEMNVDASIGATLGLGTQPAGPADMMQLLAAIETGRAKPLGQFGTEIRPEQNGRIIDLAAMGIDEAERAQVKDWLTGPVRHGTLTGTMNRIDWPGNCKPHLGKTGTNFDSPRRLSKNIVFSVTCGERLFVLYGAVWTRDLARGSIGDVTHQSLAPMLQATLEAALQN